MRKFVLFFGLLLFTHLSEAQNRGETVNTYKTAVGIRASLAPGLSVKTFLSSGSAFEGILHAREHGILLTGLYEIHKAAFNVNRLNWFYGVGAHVGSFRGGYYKNSDGTYYTENFITVGIDGILGLEYHLTEIPFTIGVDIKPFFDIISPGFGYWDGGFTLRYAF